MTRTSVTVSLLVTTTQGGPSGGRKSEATALSPDRPQPQGSQPRITGPLATRSHHPSWDLHTHPVASTNGPSLWWDTISEEKAHPGPRTHGKGSSSERPRAKSSRGGGGREMARLGTMVMARLAPTCLAPDGRHGPGWSANPSTEQWSVGSGNARPLKTWVRLPDAQAPGR